MKVTEGQRGCRTVSEGYLREIRERVKTEGER